MQVPPAHFVPAALMISNACACMPALSAHCSCRRERPRTFLRARHVHAGAATQHTPCPPHFRSKLLARGVALCSAHACCGERLLRSGHTLHLHAARWPGCVDAPPARPGECQGAWTGNPHLACRLSPRPGPAAMPRTHSLRVSSYAHPRCEGRPRVAPCDPPHILSGS